LLGREAAGAVMNSRTYTGSNSVSSLSGGPAGAAITELTGEVIDGILEVGPILGKGGMGVVYEVFHREWNRTLAMKIPLHLGGGNFDMRRWIREAHTWIDLGLHPRIVSCWFVRQWREVPALFLDLYSGGSLKEKLEGRSGPPAAPEEWAEALVWLIHACEGLAHAHHMGLIHRDIKPANLLFDANGDLAVTDFGLGKAFNKSDEADVSADPSAEQMREKFAGQDEHSLTRTGVMTGTPHYAPPEQWMQKPVGPQADIYALGVVAYQALTGRHPFEPPGERWDLGRLVTSHLMGDVVPPHAYNQGIPERLSEAVAQCLAKKPVDRPESLAVLREVLVGAYRDRTGEDYPFGMPQPLSQRADALNNKAVSLWSIGLRKEATQAWAEADRLERNHMEVSYNRMITSWLTGRRKPGEVEAAIRELAAASSRGGSALGQFLLARGEFPQAAEYLLDSLQSPGLKEDGTLWRALGEASEAAGNQPLAEEAYAKTLELIPTDSATKKALNKLKSGSAEPDEGLVAKGYFRENGNLLAWTPLESGRGLALVYFDQVVISDMKGHELARAGLPPMNVISRVESRGHHLLVIGAHEAYLMTFAVNEGKLQLQTTRHWKRDVLGFLDGDRVLTGSTTLQVRRREDEAELSALMVGHEKQVLSHLYLAKANRLVTGGADRVLRVWSLDDAQCLVEGRGHQDFIQQLALARQDQLLITGDASGMVAFWIMPKLERLQKLQFNGGITDLAVSGSGQQEVLLVSYKDEGGPYRTAVVLLDRMQVMFDEPGRLVPWSPGFALWDAGGFAAHSLPDGVEWRRLSVSDSPIERCISSPLGEELLFWTENQELIRWRLPSSVPDPPPLPLVRANTLSEVQQARLQYATLMEKAWASFRDEDWSSAYWDLSRARLVEGYAREPETLDFLSRLTQKLSRRELREMWKVRELLPPGKDQPRRLTIDEHGRWAATSSGPLIRLWDLRNGICVRGMTGHRDEVVQLSFWESEDATGGAPLLFSFSAERSVRLWDTNTGECLQTLLAGSGPAIVTVGLCRETRYYAFVDRAGRMCTGRWAEKRPFELESLAIYKPIELPEAVTVGRDGRWLIVAEDRAKVFRLPEPNSVPRLEMELDYRLTLLPTGGRHMIASKDDGSLEMYDLQDRRVLAGYPREGGAPIVAMACTRDGAVLATVDREDLLQVWLVESAHCVMERPTGEPIRKMVFSGNGRYLATLSQKGTLTVWEMEWQLDPDQVQTAPLEERLEERLPSGGVWSRLRRRFGRKG
jgi:serine/threonine protein kinase/WD40 repeat protein